MQQITLALLLGTVSYAQLIDTAAVLATTAPVEPTALPKKPKNTEKPNNNGWGFPCNQYCRADCYNLYKDDTDMYKDARIENCLIYSCACDLSLFDLKITKKTDAVVAKKSDPWASVPSDPWGSDPSDPWASDPSDPWGSAGTIPTGPSTPPAGVPKTAKPNNNGMGYPCNEECRGDCYERFADDTDYYRDDRIRNCMIQACACDLSLIDFASFAKKTETVVAKKSDPWASAPTDPWGSDPSDPWGSAGTIPTGPSTPPAGVPKTAKPNNNGMGYPCNEECRGDCYERFADDTDRYRDDRIRNCMIQACACDLSLFDAKKAEAVVAKKSDPWASAGSIPTGPSTPPAGVPKTAKPNNNGMGYPCNEECRGDCYERFADDTDRYRDDRIRNCMIQACACDLSLMSASSFGAPNSVTQSTENGVSAKVDFELEIEFSGEASFDWNTVEIAAMDWGNNNSTDPWANNTEPWNNDTNPWANNTDSWANETESWNNNNESWVEPAPWAVAQDKPWERSSWAQSFVQMPVGEMKAEVTPAVYLATVLILVGVMVGVYFVMQRLGSAGKKSDRSEQRNAYKEKFNFLQS